MHAYLLLCLYYFISAAATINGYSRMALHLSCDVAGSIPMHNSTTGTNCCGQWDRIFFQ
jgi:hypothetical protein